MQCPACDHIASQEAFGNPLRCPDCGCFYEKAVELKLKQAPQLVAPSPPAVPKFYMVCVNCGSIIHQASTSCRKCGHRYKKSSTANIVIGVIVGVVLLGLIGVFSDGPSTAGSSEPPAAPKLSPSQAALASSELVDYTWRAKFGSMMEADFTIRNNGSKAIKDIEIECVHFAPSGTKIDTNKRTIYEVIDAGKTRAFKNFDMGFIHSQVESSACNIKSVKT